MVIHMLPPSKYGLFLFLSLSFMGGGGHSNILHIGKPSFHLRMSQTNGFKSMF